MNGYSQVLEPFLETVIERSSYGRYLKQNYVDKYNEKASDETQRSILNKSSDMQYDSNYPCDLRLQHKVMHIRHDRKLSNTSPGRGGGSGEQKSTNTNNNKSKAKVEARKAKIKLMKRLKKIHQ